MTKKKFLIRCTWRSVGDFEVEADSLDEAIKTVEDGEGKYGGLPADQEYVDDSFEIDRDNCAEITERFATESADRDYKRMDEP